MHTDAQKETFERIFRPGQLHLILGEPGSGKSTTACSILDAALTEHSDYVGLGNLIFKRREADGKVVQVNPPGFTQVTSWAEVFALLPDYIEQKKNVILVIDEGGLAESAQAGSTVLQANTRDFNALLSQRRKLRLVIIVIALDSELLQRRLRTIGANVSGTFTKGIRLAGYDQRELLEAEGRIKARAFKMPIPYGLATPEPLVKPGQIYMESESPGSFDIGKLGGKPFNMGEAIRSIANVINERVPDLLRAYMTRKSSSVEPLLATRSASGFGPKDSGSGLNVSTQHNVRPGVDKMIGEGYSTRDIVSTLECSRQFVYQRRKALLAALE